MNKRKLIIIIALVLVLGGLITAGGIYYHSQSDLVYRDVFIEAGSGDITVEDLLKHEAKGAKLSKDSDYDINVPGDYKLVVQWKMPIFGKRNYKTVLHVQDVPSRFFCKELVVSTEPLYECHYFSCQFRCEFMRNN